VRLIRTGGGCVACPQEQGQLRAKLHLTAEAQAKEASYGLQNRKR
jgi:hypothetical protein